MRTTDTGVRDRCGCISMQRYWSSLRYSFHRTLFLLAADLRRHSTCHSPLYRLIYMYRYVCIDIDIDIDIGIDKYIYIYICCHSDGVEMEQMLSMRTELLKNAHNGYGGENTRYMSICVCVCVYVCMYIYI